MKIVKCVLVIAAAISAHTASARTDLMCIYRAFSWYHGLQNIVMNFSMNEAGVPVAGEVVIQRPSGVVVNIPIPPEGFRQFVAGPVQGAELGARILVASPPIDLMLNYAGNEFSRDTVQVVRRPNITAIDMVAAYAVIADHGPVIHRTAAPPVVHMEGAVRTPDGQFTRLFSSEFVCSIRGGAPVGLAGECGPAAPGAGPCVKP